MTATSNYIANDTSTEARSRVSGLGQTIRRGIGLTLVFSALGLWLAPGASFEGEVALMKLGVTFFFAATGLTLFCARGGKPAAQK